MEIFGVSARRVFDPNFFDVRKRGFSGSRVRLWVCVHVGVVVNSHVEVVVIVHVGDVVMSMMNNHVEVVDE